MADPVREKCTNGYCEIPSGTFQMGRTDGWVGEQPVRNVTMTGFELRQTEVSVRDYEAYCRTRASGLFGTLRSLLSGHGWDGLKNCIPFKRVNRENEKGGSFPVVNLSYDEKRAYCKAEGGDLPTAAQLHFASRFDDQDSTTGKLITWSMGFRTTVPVNGGYKNRFGIYNLLGNVWESARDVYSPYFYERMPSKDPYNPPDEPPRSNTCYELSGGSTDPEVSVYPGVRACVYYSKFSTTYEIGFRCARPLAQDATKAK